MNKQLLKNFIIDIAISMSIALIVSVFIRPTIVNGASMEDTLHDGDYMFMSRQAYRNHNPEKGDIVIIQSTLDYEKSDKGKLIIKRVIGLPGDTVEIRGDTLYVNGEQIQEDYIKDGITPAGDIPAEGETLTVPEGSFFVLGDNRCNSTDSRSSEVGLITKEDIKGKVFLRLFPFTRIDLF